MTEGYAWYAPKIGKIGIKSNSKKFNVIYQLNRSVRQQSPRGPLKESNIGRTFEEVQEEEIEDMTFV